MSDSIEQILKNENLIVHFQPIISLSGRTLFGFESLIRGINHDGSIIAPVKLFEMARNRGVTLELDKLARTLAIKAFEPLWKSDNRLILFVNFEPKLIEQFEAGNPLFYGELQKLGIPYENIVLEVKEDEIENTEKLKAFCDYYRNIGFNIALDDFGAGQSSFDRIAIVRPDIIKIDRSLITNIENNQIHQEIVNAICKMCQNIGALPLAEGVESLDETICCISHGTILMQGFHFARPSTAPIDNSLKDKVHTVQSGYSEMLKNVQLEITKVHAMAAQVEQQFYALVEGIENIKDWWQYSLTLLDKHPSIEALYLIDHNNKQVGSTLIKTQTRALYEPTTDGYDFSLKEYHIRVKNTINGKHLTRPYLSMASGSLCRTHSSRVSIMGISYVLCIDFIV
jgi:EAL domain-containing protein (putative c-di-GMP-specific phosphodiesterase class I)